MNISVVIATYGDEEWAHTAERVAVPSVMAQQRAPHEFITWHSSLPTIGPARNEAAEKATGDWLLFLDADDELDPRFIRAMNKAVRDQTPSTGFVTRRVYTPRVSYVVSGRRRAPRFLRRPGLTLKDDNYLVVGTLIQKTLFDNVGGFSDYPHGFEDWSLWAKAWKTGAEVIEVPGAIYYAHVNPNSAHRVAWRNRDEQVAMHHKVRQELFPEEYA